MPANFAPAVLERAVSAELDARPVETPAARNHAPIHWTIAGMAAGQIADGVTTYLGLRRAGTREGNSVLYGPHPSAARIAATKAASVGLVAWITDRLYARHPKTAMSIAGAMGAVGFAAAAHNHRTGR